MLSVLRRAVAVAAVAAFSAGAVEAQMGGLKVEEIRVDVAGLEMVSDAYTQFGVGIPGSVALGIYLNDKLALEPTLSLVSFTPEGFDAQTIISIGVFAPFYFAGDRGRNGLFVAPGVAITKITDVDALIDFGADVGYKKAMNDKVSWSAAAMLRAGDSTDPEMLLGGRFGLSVFWR
ncbi:MAG: hypothetical protein WD771_00535 [Gemmatimonadaceae bacterium]